jgi:hypothetical protein
MLLDYGFRVSDGRDAGNVEEWFSKLVYHKLLVAEFPVHYD